MTETPHPGTDGLSADQRHAALGRFQVIRPYLEEGIPLTQIAQEHKLGVRTVSRWAADYHQLGLAGLCRRPRNDRDTRKMSPTLQQFIEGLALHRPHLSAAAVHREAALIAARLGEPVPCYRTVHMVIGALEPALVTLAHEGAKAYSDAFGLVHRTEAEGPNAIWQADHTELDLFVTDDSGQPRKPWLTIVLDDHSRAIAGYLLFFGAPSAIQTALALRQAIWLPGGRGRMSRGRPCGGPRIPSMRRNRVRSLTPRWEKSRTGTATPDSPPPAKSPKTNSSTSLNTRITITAGGDDNQRAGFSG